MNLIHAQDIIRYIRASAGRAGINVVFENTNKPRHDGKTIYLPHITAKTTHQDLIQLLANTDHEVGHDLLSDFDAFTKYKFDSNSLLGFVVNMLEDSRVNSIEADEYEGFRQNWDMAIEPAVTERIPTEEQLASPQAKIVSSILHWDAVNNEERFPSIAVAGSKFPIQKEHEKLLEKYTPELKALRTVTDKEIGTRMAVELARKILVDNNMEEEAKEVPQEDEGKKEKGEGKESKEGEGNETEQDEGKGESKEDEGEQKEEESLEFDMEEVSKLLPGTQHDKEYIVNRTGKKMISPPCFDYSTWTAATDYVVVNHVTKTGPNKFLNPPVDLNNYHLKLNSVRGSSTDSLNFAQQVRRLLQIISRVKYEHGVKKGKLDQARLARVCLKDAHGFNERLFKRKIESKLLDVAITVLVDCSGSMNGRKHFQSVLASQLLNETLSNALHIPVAIEGFSDTRNTPVMWVVKEFDKKVSDEQLTESFSKIEGFMNGNPDGDSIVWSYDRLVKRKEKKKVMIVLSDGSPASSIRSGSGRGLVTYTKKVVEEIQKEGIVDIYGIGIMDNSVQHYYKHNTVLNDASELAPVLLKVIEDKILNHN